MRPILEKKFEIVNKNIGSNIRIFLGFRNKKQRTKKLTSFVFPQLGTVHIVLFNSYLHSPVVVFHCHMTANVVQPMQIFFCLFTAAARDRLPRHCHHPTVHLVREAPTGPDKNT